MKEFALILVSTILVNNFVLVKFLGLCPFMGVSRKLETAMGMALATTFVLTLSAVFSYLIETYLLAPFGLSYLRIIAFILVIAAVVQLTEMIVHKTSPLLYQVLGIFLPLITTNCAVLGVALLNVQQAHNFVQSFLPGSCPHEPELLHMVLVCNEDLRVMRLKRNFRSPSLQTRAIGV